MIDLASLRSRSNRPDCWGGLTRLLAFSSEPSPTFLEGNLCALVVTASNLLLMMTSGCLASQLLEKVPISMEWVWAASLFWELDITLPPLTATTHRLVVSVEVWALPKSCHRFPFFAWLDVSIAKYCIISHCSSWEMSLREPFHGQTYYRRLASFSSAWATQDVPYAHFWPYGHAQGPGLKKERAFWNSPNC